MSSMNSGQIPDLISPMLTQILLSWTHLFVRRRKGNWIFEQKVPRVSKVSFNEKKKWKAKAKEHRRSWSHVNMTMLSLSWFIVIDTILQWELLVKVTRMHLSKGWNCMLRTRRDEGMLTWVTKGLDNTFLNYLVGLKMSVIIPTLLQSR